MMIAVVITSSPQIWVSALRFLVPMAGALLLLQLYAGDIQPPALA
jgi:hypothetical protein